MTANMSVESQIASSPPTPNTVLVLAQRWRSIARNGRPIAGAFAALAGAATIAFLAQQWRTMDIREKQTETRLSVLEYRVAAVNDATTDELAHITALNAKTVELARGVKEAEQDAIAAQVGVAELRLETADLTQRDQTLEQATFPRRMSTAQRNDIVTAWKKYSGRSVTLWSYELDAEGDALSEQIRDCLTSAGVVVVNNIGRMSTATPLRIGIQIAGVDRHLVGAVYAGLKNIGQLDTTEVELSDSDRSEAVPVEIFIGRKPLAQSNN